MLIVLAEWYEKLPDISRLHKGVVVDNLDPEQIGRVKVEIPGVLEGPKEDLPWVYPIAPAALGGRPDSSLFVVPEVDTHLAMWFPDNLPYFGYYIGFFVNHLTHHILADVDYPESYGFRDKDGTFLLVNKKEDYLYLEHSSGTKIQINRHGDLQEHVVRDKRVFVERDLYTHVKGNVYTIFEKDVFDHYKGAYHRVIDKDFHEKYNGSMFIQVAKNYNMQAENIFTDTRGNRMDNSGASTIVEAIASVPAPSIPEENDIVGLDPKYRNTERPSSPG